MVMEFVVATAVAGIRFSSTESSNIPLMESLRVHKLKRLDHVRSDKTLSKKNM
jgi:hypothetical protein